MLRPFIVTYWSGRQTDDMPDEVYAVIDAAGMRHQHINLGLFALDENGKLLRSLNPNVRPPAHRFDPELQGRDFKRQLDEMLDGLKLPHVVAKHPIKLTLPDVSGNESLAGVRIYLTFGKNRLNHYRTPTVEAVTLTAKMREALRYPEHSRSVSADQLRPMLEQFYPPAIMDGHGGCREIKAEMTLSPAGFDGNKKCALLKGTVEIELDNTNATRYSGPLSIAMIYDESGVLKSLRGVGTWEFPKYTPEGRVAEWIQMTAAIESRPE